VQVIDTHLGLFHPIASTTAPAFTHSGLTPDQVYIYRIIAVATPGSGQGASSPSGLLYVTTRPVPESVPPTAPGRPTISSIGTVGATVNVSPATDNQRVAGYVVQREIGGVWTDVATNNITTMYLRDLTPDTSYTVAAVAFDPNGNRSPRSASTTFRTRPTQPAPVCRVQLLTFGRQYNIYVTIENMTAATVLENWTVTFTLPAAHTVSTPFNATLARTGDVATASPVFYNSRIGPGGGTTFGFSGSYPTGSPLPSGFALNATTPCV
jgi:hypothetical protein